MALNNLQAWEEQHWKNVDQELKEAGLSWRKEDIEKIIELMSFKERSKRHPKKCTLYPAGKPCHDQVEDLNCLLCSCPQYDSSTKEGGCKIKSRYGFLYQSQTDPTIRVWDCSNCTNYHSPAAVRNFIGKNLARLASASSKPL
jgi:Zn-finger protein